MAIIPILTYPNKRLNEPGKIVINFNKEIHKIVDDMFETHYNSKNCAALAATQLDLEPYRITVIDFSTGKNEPLCLINPKIIKTEGEHFEIEGCMSLPGIYQKVKRFKNVTVSYQDISGKEHELKADAFLAKCIQHELDHLNGKLFLEHLSNLQRMFINNKLKKLSQKAKT